MLLCKECIDRQKNYQGGTNIYYALKFYFVLTGDV